MIFLEKCKMHLRKISFTEFIPKDLLKRKKEISYSKFYMGKIYTFSKESLRHLPEIFVTIFFILSNKIFVLTTSNMYIAYFNVAFHTILLNFKIYMYFLTSRYHIIVEFCCI